MIIKEEKAITMIALVITIVLLLILSGIAIYGGTNSILESEDKKISIELNIIQHAVLETYKKHLSTSKVIENSDALVGRKLSNSNINENYIVNVDGKYYFKYDTDVNKIELKDTTISNYYLISTEDEFKKLGISNCKDKYVVNYTTGEVLNVQKLKTNSNQALYVYNNN